ncbi:MAG: hypothetical protein OEZ04_08090 [Nitrospinota bacterium]|nr:hypothetical protein [Nitrospinota bacterium]
MNKIMIGMYMVSATGDSPTELSPWLMDNLPLIMGVIFLLPLLITGLAVYKIFFAGRKDLIQRRARASEAVAQVVSIEQAVGQARIRGKSYIKVRLRLKVDDSFSGDYELDTVWWIDFLFTSQVQQGAAISIKVETGEGGQVFPNVPWAGISMADLFLAK